MLALEATTTWYTELRRAGEFSPRTFHTRIFGGCDDIAKAYHYHGRANYWPCTTNSSLPDNGKAEASHPNKARTALMWQSINGLSNKST